jgi:predicted ATPase/class 3 adenylate cyclase
MPSGRLHYILLTDIGRSSHLWEAFPQRYPAVLEAHNRIVADAVAACGGTVMKNTGDGFFALFDSAEAAVGAAARVQLQVAAGGAALAFPDGTQLAVRSVVHGGPLQRLAGQAGDWFGPPLNRTARICGVCHAGQALLSSAVRSALGDGPPAGCLIHDLGLHRLRDLGAPEHLYQLVHPGFAQHDFPPLVTLDSRPNNLRDQPNAFIGRERELDELFALLTDGSTRLVTLLAPGGYGKSRLASQAGAELLSRFPHGVFEVRLAEIDDPTRLLEAVAAAAGFQFFGNRDPQQQLRDFLRGKELLLLLDNCEHVLAGIAVVSDLLQTARKLRVLATSREPLRLTGERLYRLEPLAGARDGGAVQLFADRAALVRPAFALSDDAAGWAERICQRLGGVPLAIELAAAWADSFTLPEMYEELEQQLHLAARLTDLPERQRSVRASCDWSWSLLPPEQQAALLRLAPFRGGFFLDAAEAVLGLRGFALRGLLSSLCDKGWLMAGEPGPASAGPQAHKRYSIRDAASHEYIRERLDEAGSGAALQDSLPPPPVLGARHEAAREATAFRRVALQAHAAYCAALLEAEGPRLSGAGEPDGGAGQHAALQRFRLEFENLLAALDTALAEGAVAWLLAQARHLGKYLDTTSAFQRMDETYQRLLAAAQQLQAAELELQARLGLGMAAFRRGRYAPAEEQAAAAAALARALGEDAALASALRLGATALSFHGGSAAAEPALEESLALCCRAGDRRGENAALLSLGVVAYNQGRYAEARGFYLQALGILRELGDRRNEARLLVNLANVEYQLRDLAEARRLQEQAIAALRESGDRQGEANALSNLGAVEFREGRLEEARALFVRALDILRDAGDRQAEAMTLGNIGSAEQQLGGRDAAAAAHRAALELWRAVGDGVGLALSCALVAALLDGADPRSTALALLGALHQAAALGCEFEPEEQQVIDAGLARLQAVLARGTDGAAALAELREAAAALTLDELAGFTLRLAADAGGRVRAA